MHESRVLCQRGSMEIDFFGIGAEGSPTCRLIHTLAPRCYALHYWLRLNRARYAAMDSGSPPHDCVLLYTSSSELAYMVASSSKPQVAWGPVACRASEQLISPSEATASLAARRTKLTLAAGWIPFSFTTRRMEGWEGGFGLVNGYWAMWVKGVRSIQPVCWSVHSLCKMHPGAF